MLGCKNRTPAHAHITVCSPCATTGMPRTLSRMGDVTTHLESINGSDPSAYCTRSLATARRPSCVEVAAGVPFAHIGTTGPTSLLSQPHGTCSSSTAGPTSPRHVRPISTPLCRPPPDDRRYRRSTPMAPRGDAHAQSARHFALHRRPGRRGAHARWYRCARFQTLLFERHGPPWPVASSDEKMWPYETDIRSLGMRGPGITPGIALDLMGVNMDIAPTLLDLAGVQIPKNYDGRSPCRCSLRRGERQGRTQYLGARRPSSRLRRAIVLGQMSRLPLNTSTTHTGAAIPIGKRRRLHRG